MTKMARWCPGAFLVFLSFSFFCHSKPNTRRTPAALRPDLPAITNETLRFVPSRGLVPATTGPFRFRLQDPEKRLPPPPGRGRMTAERLGPAIRRRPPRPAHEPTVERERRTWRVPRPSRFGRRRVNRIVMLSSEGQSDGNPRSHNRSRRLHRHSWIFAK